MMSLLPSITNLTLHWTWLGHLILSIEGFTVLLFSFGTCKVDTLLQTFSAGAVPWFLLDEACEGSSFSFSSTVVILSDSPNNTKQAITRAASVVNAYRARYFLVQCGYVEETVIRTLISFAWTNKLYQVIVVLLEDKAIYAVQPNCQEPQVIQVPTVQWPDLQKLSLTGCTVRIAVSNISPFLVYDNTSDDTNLGGFFIPFYRYIKEGLNFEALLVSTPFANMSSSVIEGKADMLFGPTYFTPNLTLEISTTYITAMGWCVPDSCILGGTSRFLWCEFNGMTWTLLIASVFAVSVSVHFLNRPNTTTLVDSLFRILPTVASTATKMPHGHARLVFVGWLFAVLVLSTAYQTALHSMMTAPTFVQEIADERQLLESKIRLICMATSSCPKLMKQAEGDTVLTALAARSEEMDLSAGFSYGKAHQKTSAVYHSYYTCKYYFTEMQALINERTLPVQFGLFAVNPSSFLAPALRRLASQAKASGLASLWSRRDVQKLSCSSPKKKRDLQPITVGVLWPAILLMFAGFAFASIAFISELWYSQKNQEAALLHHPFDVVANSQRASVAS